MFRISLVLLFIAMTILCWGTYAPVLHEGQMAMEFSRLRPFICVGIAYFLVAVAVPFAISRFQNESGRWTFRGVVWSLVAGAVGALGSLGIIIAFTLGARPIYVMPLVFGCAPVVNTLVTMLMSPAGKRPSWLFYLGILMVALGGAGVLAFKPKPVQIETAALASVATPVRLAQVQSDNTGNGNTNDQGDAAPASGAPGVAGAKFANLMGSIATVIMTVLCWGSYGPLLHRGQARMDGSRMRPFMCVGIAYFFVAILFPSMILAQVNEPGLWSFDGSLWSLLAGVLGAVGALGIIMAFNYGGRPVYVMPLVFGGAPVINTFTSMLQSYFDTGIAGRPDVTFITSLALVIAGAATVLIFAPRAPKSAPQVEPPAPADDDQPAEPGDDSKTPQSAAESLG